jgi:hypothetical protein
MTGAMSDEIMDVEFDFNHALESTSLFVDGLLSFNVLVMCNDEPDIQVMELQYDSQVAPLLLQVLGDGYVQTIVNNRHEATRVRCPYFRVCTTDFNEDTIINFKLRSFYNKIGMSSMNPRCTKAVVIGLATLSHLESNISVPTCFCSTKIDLINLDLESEIDVSCMELCAQHHHPGGYNLADIAGLVLPYHVPHDVQHLILRYCSSPTADLIKQAMTRVRHEWDVQMYTMFLQREPRIPVHIASIYNACTVQKTAADATRPFLVPAALASENAYPSRRSS